MVKRFKSSNFARRYKMFDFWRDGYKGRKYRYKQYVDAFLLR